MTMGFTLAIGAEAPPFEVRGVDDQLHRLWDYDAAPFLVISFTCNHCPYVIGNEAREKAFVEKYAKQGLVYIAINSNDATAYPADDFVHMKERAKSLGFTWPYLHDETQLVAKAYGAIKTPQFFLFDEKKKLRYVGRMDDSPRDGARATTHELADAVEALLAMQEVKIKTTEPIGCTVKWHANAGNSAPEEKCDVADLHKPPVPRP